MIGIWQLVLIFAIVLVLFGAGKIPNLMKDLGTGLRAFKKGFDGDEDVEPTNNNKKVNKKKKTKVKNTKSKNTKSKKDNKNTNKKKTDSKNKTKPAVKNKKQPAKKVKNNKKVKKNK